MRFFQLLEVTPEAKEHDSHVIRQGLKLKPVHTLLITLRDTNTSYRKGCHKLNFLSPGIFLSCHRHNYHTPAPKQPLHLTITIKSTVLELLSLRDWKLLTSSTNFTHDCYKTIIKPVCANIILFL